MSEKKNETEGLIEELTEDQVEKQAKVSDEAIAEAWTRLISSGGYVQDVADELELDKAKLQTRVNILRKYLKDAGVPQDENLPKASKRARRKDLTSIQMAIATARQRAADAFAKADETLVS